MYLVLLKSLVVDALQQTFSSSFLPADLQGLHVSMEYPLERQHYPGCWVNYEDQGNLTIAGIDHVEIVYNDPNNPAAGAHEVTRWKFSGEVTLTVTALSSLERDNLYDQFVRIFAFSRLENAAVVFRSVIETNDFIAANVNWDDLRPHGDAASPGTPWGTEDEVIYEKSVGFDIVGEFVSDPDQNTLALLSAIHVTGTNSDDPDSDPGDAFVLGVPRGV